MTEMKRTPWFPASVDPVREGLYECRYEGETEVTFRFYDGTHWRFPFSKDASLFGSNGYGGDKWRGLAEQPK